MAKNKECACPHCETELKKGCMQPAFCKPCGIVNKNIKICPECKAEYLAEYEECPSCVSAGQKNSAEQKNSAGQKNKE